MCRWAEQSIFKLDGKRKFMTKDMDPEEVRIKLKADPGSAASKLCLIKFSYLMSLAQ